MKVYELVKLFDMGGLNISKNSTDKVACIGGVNMMNNMLCGYVKSLGWVGHSVVSLCDSVKFTRKVVNEFKNLKCETIYNCEVSFESMRLADSTHVYYRVHLVDANGDFLTILNGAPSVGGNCVIYDGEYSKTKPVFCSRSLKHVVVFLNDNYE